MHRSDIFFVPLLNGDVGQHHLVNGRIWISVKCILVGFGGCYRRAGDGGIGGGDGCIAFVEVDGESEFFFGSGSVRGCVFLGFGESD
jgi:hypothetical protein